MNKYDALRYALNNNNRLPLERTPRPRNAPAATARSAASTPSTARASAVARSTASLGSRALGAASLLSHASDVGAGSDRPRGSNGGLGMTKAETAGRLAASKSARKTAPMSPMRPDSSTNKRVTTKASGYASSPEVGAKRMATKASGSASSGKQSFGKAFKAARKAGKKTFNWSGKSYTTKVK